MDLHAPSRAASPSLLGGPPRYEGQPLPFGRSLGRNWFKCYRYFKVEEAACSQSASPAFGWRGRLRDPRVACLRQVQKKRAAGVAVPRLGFFSSKGWLGCSTPFLPCTKIFLPVFMACVRFVF